MNKAIEITDANIDDIINSHAIVLVDFNAEWCGPCRMIGPVIDQLAIEETDVMIGKLNVDGNPQATMKYMVSSIPTIIFFKDGLEINRIKGVMSKAALKAEIEKLK